MSLEGYTGPTSGRITVGGDGPAEVERFYDEPLTPFEQEQTAQFRALSPNAQLRQVVQLQSDLSVTRMSLDVVRGEVETLRTALREAHRQETRLRAEVAQRPPEGYARPAIVRDLMEHAENAGWTARCAWGTPDTHDDVALAVRLTIHLAEAGDWIVDLNWSCQPGGKGRRIRSGIMRSPGRDWYDAPSVVRLKEIIARNAQGG